MSPSDCEITLRTAKRGAALDAAGKERVRLASFTVNPSKSMGDIHKGQEGPLEPLTLARPRKASSSNGRDGLGPFRRKTFRAQDEVVSGSLKLDHYPGQEVAVLSVEASAATQRYWWKGYKFGLSGEGAAVIRVELPHFDKGLAFFMWEEYWCHPSFPGKLSEIPQLSRMLLWREKDGLFGCLMPLVGGDCVTYLKGVPGAVEARVSTFNEGQASTQAPALLAAFGRDPYALVEKATECALKRLGRPAEMRARKKFPKPLETLGWCTWDAFYRKVNAKGIRQQLQSLEKKKFPLGFVIIDDGWFKMVDNQLMDTREEKSKFPAGLAPVVREIKRRFKVPFVGLWHSLTGYWYGIHPDNKLEPALKRELIFTKGWPPAPPTEEGPAKRFWDRWHAWMERQGVDFVKVDGQGNVPRYCRNRVPVAPACGTVQKVLQDSVRKHFDGSIINCMSMGPEQTWFYRESNITRSSNDYMFEGKEFDLGVHARVNAYNSLWLSQVSWCDWDMFWSASPNAEYHAALRALSGGPVYVSDRVGKVNPAKLWPLILKDGTLIRCDEVGQPTMDCLLEDPGKGRTALKVMNTSGQAGLIGLFHASNVKKPIRSSFRPSDIRGLKGDLFAVWASGKGRRGLMRREETLKVTLGPRRFMILTAVPISGGFAPLGLTGKIVAPKTVLDWRRVSTGVRVSLAEGGEFAAFSLRPPRRVKVGNRSLGFKWSDGWLDVRVPDVSRPVVRIEY